MSHIFGRTNRWPCVFVLLLAAFSSSCGRAAEPLCDRPDGSTSSNDREAEAVAKHIGEHLSDRPWRQSGFSDRKAFVVTRSSTIGTVPVILAQPRWVTDSRPYLLACQADGGLVATGGFPRPDREMLSLLHAASSDSLALLAVASEAAAILDPNATSASILGIRQTATLGDTEMLASTFGVGEYLMLAPRLSVQQDGVEVTLHLESPASWSSMGGVDYWRLRVRVNVDGTIRWVDRVVLDGIWRLSRAGPDSVRVE